MANERSWQGRALERLRNNQTMPGAILLAVLGRATTPPRLGRQAKINYQGIVITSLTSKSHGWNANIPICHKDDLVGAFRKLCDVLKFTDAERHELFLELRRWIERDDSAPYNIEERLGIKPRDGNIAPHIKKD